MHDVGGAPVVGVNDDHAVTARRTGHRYVPARERSSIIRSEYPMPGPSRKGSSILSALVDGKLVECLQCLTIDLISDGNLPCGYTLPGEPKGFVVAGDAVIAGNVELRAARRRIQHNISSAHAAAAAGDGISHTD